MDPSVRKIESIDNPAPTTITQKDFEDYLFRVFFGSENDLVRACIDRAYLEFNRTLHGMGKMASADEIKSKAVDLLKSQLHEIKKLLVKNNSPEGFDEWHKTTCEMLIALYKECGFHFFVGQAQKWVNMTLKYVFTFGEQRIPGYKWALPYCHAPIDNIVLQKLTKYGFPPLNCAWSRLDVYEVYIDRQNWIRRTFGKGALIVEFQLWLGKEVGTEE